MSRSILRLLNALPLLAGCESDYAITNQCEADGRYTICHRETDHDEAVAVCEDFGGLVEVDTYKEGKAVAMIGIDEFEGGWWVGWGGFDCPVMSQGIGSFPVPCDRVYPFICELE